MDAQRPLVTIATEEFQPYSKIHYRDDGSIYITGLMRNYINIMSDYLHFDYVMKRPDDHVFGGFKLANGSWSGATGLVHRGEADLFIGPSGINPEWDGAVRYTIPFVIEANMLVMIRPTTVNDIGNFLKPFTPQVWWMVLSSLVCITIAMALLTWIEEGIFSSTSKFLPSRTIMWAVQTVSQESTEWLPKEAGGRILELTWLFASLVFMSSYAGILTAMLTIPTVVIPIDSKEDLVKQTAIPWRMRASSRIQKYLRDSESEVDQKVYAGSQTMPTNCWHARESVRNGEFVAICTIMTSRQILAWDFSETARCHMYIGKEPVYAKNHGVITFNPDAPYFEDTNMIILRIHQAGLMDKWMADETKNATQCLKPPGSEERDGTTPALTLEALLGPFALHVTGMILGILVFILELLVHNYNIGKEN